MSEQRFPTPILHHVNLKAVRLAEMVEWYTRVLGIVANHISETGAWLTTTLPITPRATRRPRPVAAFRGAPTACSRSQRHQTSAVG